MKTKTANKSWVEKTPNVCGGDACIRDTRMPVWSLVAWRKMGLTDDRIRIHHPQMSQEDLEAAWEYYEKNQDEIETEIKENEEA